MIYRKTTTLNSTFFFLGLISLVLTGCATTNSSYSGSESQPATQWLNTSGIVTLLSPEHSEQLAKAVPGQTVTLGQTPWGKETRIAMANSYFSATGKTCFTTAIETTGKSLPATLCKYPQGRWGVTRALTVTDSMQNNASLEVAK